MKLSENISRLTWRLAIALWAVGTLGAWVWATNYEFTSYSENQSIVSEHWPDSSNLRHAEDRPTLLCFIHPRCPCTRASVHEIGRVLTGTGLTEGQQPNVIVVASMPDGASDDWKDTPTVRQATELPRAELFWDENGVESKRFEMVTSGAVRLYDRDGQLLFSGGVTASRGHQGDNLGCDFLYQCLTDANRQPMMSTPVFGCRIYAETQPKVAGETR